MTADGSPDLVVAADWGVRAEKRWMARALLESDESYLVFPPEPVGDVKTLLKRIQDQVGSEGSALVAFDFPIGLPEAYACRTPFAAYREALSQFGHGDWSGFYEVSDKPTLRQPFYPPPTQEGGKYRKAVLAQALGVDNFSELLRRCDRPTRNRGVAECVFFTLGARQVGRGAIIGWRDVFTPALDQIRIWPFDGDLGTLLRAPGIVVAEYYPAEAYSYLGFSMRVGHGLSKRRRSDRQVVASKLLDTADGRIWISDAARSWIEWGFLGEDDFDAMVGALSMLGVVTAKRLSGVPEDDTVRNIEGWILGQAG